MKETKIDWCDCTVNPVVGCANGCAYCYAEKLNKRFKFVNDWKHPQFFADRLRQFYEKTPRSIFIDSMSDIGTWQDEWLHRVLSAINENPQHWYLALTKTNVNALVNRLMKFQLSSNEPLRLFIGKSVTTQSQVNALVENKEITDFLSVEPILEYLDMSDAIVTTRTVIIGAETGNRKGKVIPKKEWIDDIVMLADYFKINVFMKESLLVIMGDQFRQDILPCVVRK